MTLPAWCEPLPDGARMRATDAWAIEQQGIPSLELMERAGEGLATVAAELPRGVLAVVCGKGNNGGDGYVAARLLRERGREVRVLTTAPTDELAGDARANFERLPGDAPLPFVAGALDGAAGAIDAILGTGFSGAPHGAAGDAITALNASGLPVIAADIPSGVDATSGEIAGEAVRAVATATFHAAKAGLWIHPGKAHAGEVHVIDIGIPAGAPGDSADIGLITDAVLAEVPQRGAETTKFSSGHVLIAGGARGMTGAVCLAARAAARAGAGYVTVCVPEALLSIFEIALTEAVKLGLPDTSGVQKVLDAADRQGGALVLGCGLGRSHHAVAFARHLAAQTPLPLVVDADGLNAHAGALDAFAARAAPTVLTPHAGELARLLDVDSAEIGARRLHHVREAAARSGAIVVLKGDDTLIATPDGRVFVSRGRAPGLATAGTGDVLAGTCGALLAAGLDAPTAVAAAVHAHARAGRLAATPHGPTGVIASDVIAALPAAFGGQ